MDNDSRTQIWFIHGANSSPVSFTYMKEKLREDPALFDAMFVDVQYDCSDKLSDVVKTIAANLPRDTPIHFVGHSLGGVVSVAISQRVSHFKMPIDIRSVVTIASPLGGSESADYLQWMYPSYHLFKNISTRNKVIKDMKSVGAVVPTLSLVTTSGNNPLFPTANDGVVTVKSQRALSGVDYIEVPFNHFESLLSRDVVDHVRLFLTV